jgi:hypothetical protein
MGVYHRYEVKYKARTVKKFSDFPGEAEAMFPLITDLTVLENYVN